jgi:hypothetical protein
MLHAREREPGEQQEREDRERDQDLDQRETRGSAGARYCRMRIR